MLDVFAIVFPAFGLIALGFIAARWRYISKIGHRGLSEFAFNVAIPGMLFHKMATAGFPDATPLALWISFFSALFITWGLATIATRHLLHRPAADAPSIAMSSTFGNTVMLGIPLAVGRYGDAALAPIALILSLHSPLLWITATLHLAASDQQGDHSVAGMAKRLMIDLVSNPIIVALFAGTLWRQSGIGFAAPVDRLLLLLGQASVPTALFALGLSLNEFQIKGQGPTLTVICLLKMLVMPAVAWVLAIDVFALAPASAGVVVLLAACPTGSSAFLFASRTGRALDSTSGAVALGVVLAAFSASALLYWLPA